MVGDVLLDERPLNIDKLFTSQDQFYSSLNPIKDNNNSFAKKTQNTMNILGSNHKFEDSMFMLSPDYMH